MKNIILIGMPGSGKSTVGVILAKTLCADFCDTDLLIQNRYKKTLQQIIAEEGTETFLDIERDIIRSLNISGSVIATGGSAVCRASAMESLKSGGSTVYLEVPYDEICGRIDNITTRGIALAEGQTLHDVYEFRHPLYERYADITVKSGGTVEQTVADIIALLFPTSCHHILF